MNSFKLIRPMVLKEFRQIRRDPTSLGMLLILPAVLIVLVGYALSFDVKHIPLAVLDQSKSSESRAYVDKFKNTEYFDCLYSVSSYPSLETLFVRNAIRIALVIPRDFAAGLSADKEPKVQIIVDGSDATSATQALTNAAGITIAHSSEIARFALLRQNINEYVPVDLHPRVWYNPELRSANFLVPGLIGFILVLTAVVSTSMTIVREKEKGTMEQLIVSPLRPLHIVFGKTIPYLVISLLGATVILLLGYFLFGISIKGSLLLLYLGILTIVLGALGQGLLISTVTDSQQVAFMLSVFSSLLPSFLLSGFVFPIASMPVALQLISNIAVNKFFLIVIRGIMLKGAGLASLWPQYLYMMLFAGVTLGLSTYRMSSRKSI